MAASDDASAVPGDRHRRVAVVMNGWAGWLPPRVLTPWLGDQDYVDRLRGMEKTTRLDLVRLGTIAGQDELADPALGLPLTTALAVLAGERLLAGADPERVVIAGHGTGGIAAAVLAGLLDVGSGLALAVQIGRALSASATVASGGQVALLGGYPPEIEERAAALGLSIAAYNGPAGIVVAGRSGALAELLSDPPRHSRAEPLPAAGAFGSHLMASASAEAHAAVQRLTIGEPLFPLISARHGLLTRGKSFLEELTDQLSGLVHWDLIMTELAGLRLGLIMELPPAGALTGLIVRGMPGVNAAPLRTPADVEEAGLYVKCR